MEPLFVLLFIGVVVVVGVVAMKNKQAQLAAWRHFAHEHRLKILNASAMSNPRMVGRYRDTDVTLQIEVHGSGKHRKTYTRATARFRSAMPRGLNITAEGFTDRLAKLVGGQDIQIGHAELDAKLRIRGEDELAVRQLMQRWRARDAIAAFLARDGKATVTQHQCSVLRHGFVSQPVELRGMLESVTRTVGEIERALGEDGATAPSEQRDIPPAPETPPVGRFDWEPAEGPAPLPPELGDLPPEVAALLEQTGAFSTTHEVIEITQSGPDGTRTHRETWIDGERQEPSEQAPPPPFEDATTSPEASFFDAFPSVDEPAAPEAEPPPPPPRVEEAAPPPVPFSAAEPVATTTPSPSSSAVGGEAALEDLLALDGRLASSGDKKAAAARMVGRRLRFELEVERVSLTMGMGVPPELEGGRTVIGRPAGHGGPRLAVRFPKERDAELDGLGYGDRLSVMARFDSWDEFYRQAKLDAQSA
jgi:hypothetical protein